MTEKKKPGLFLWALNRLVRAPSAWLGAAAGVAVGIPMAEVSTTGGAVGFGSMVGIAAALVSQGVYRAVKSSRAKSGEKAAREKTDAELNLLEKMKTAGLETDADVMRRLFEARRDVRERCAASETATDLIRPSLDLVSKISEAAAQRAGEMLDLAGRMNDPVLDAPEDAEARIADCREDLARAYRAVADSRSRLLLQKLPSAEETLRDTRIFDRGGLKALTGALESETEVMRGVDRRLRGEVYSGSEEEEASEPGDLSIPPEMESER